MRIIIFLVILFSAVSIQRSVASNIVLTDTIPRDTTPSNSYKRFLALPLVIRSPETDWGFGAAFAYFFKAKKNEFVLRTSDINFLAIYTLKKQQLFVLNSTVYFPHEKKILRFQASYSYYPDKFWGIGNNTPDSAAENYSLNQYFINPQFLFKTFSNFYIGINYEYQHTDHFQYIKNGVFDQDNVNGRYGANTSGVGPLITWDTRNNAFSPDRGLFSELNVTTYNKAIGSDFNFSTIKLDLRKFFHITTHSVLAVQALSQTNFGTAPFRNLSFLGGSDIMRGYYKGRYADNNLMAYQAEFRQHIAGRFGATGFISAGQVSQHLNDFSINQFHYAYGGGIRFMLKEKEKLNLRIDYGIGKHTNGLYLLIKEAF